MDSGKHDALLGVSSDSEFPRLDYEGWRETKETLHRFEQVVGKLRLASSARQNHWWNVPFHLTGSGITTRPMGRDVIFTIDFDFIDHRLQIATGRGQRVGFSLVGHSVASFTVAVMQGLKSVGVNEEMSHPYPFALPDSERRFDEDNEHETYDPQAVTTYWRILSAVNLVLAEFAARWSGKTSPVHHFWHTFDLAVTRFGEKVISHPRTVDLVTREAYSRQVISFGFWFGDPTYPRPAFYAYAAPEPAGVTESDLEPSAARWVDRGGSHLAVLDYDEVRASEDPRTVILNFLESAYRAVDSRISFNFATLDCANGVTDPLH